MRVLERLTEYDKSLRRKHNVEYICGVDETGRGAWAGPIVAGAVIFGNVIPEDLTGLNDSKQMTAETRDKMMSTILQCALGWGIHSVSPRDIDRYGIDAANITCMNGAAKAALAMLKVKQSEAEEALMHGIEIPENIKAASSKIYYVVDQSPGFEIKPFTMIPKADATSLACAAASVLAKTQRDKFMCELAPLYPKYSFETHKGYINDVHKQAVRDHGMIEELYRKSYKVSGVTTATQMSFEDLFGE